MQNYYLLLDTSKFEVLHKTPRDVKFCYVKKNKNSVFEKEKINRIKLYFYNINIEKFIFIELLSNMLIFYKLKSFKSKRNTFEFTLMVVKIIFRENLPILLEEILTFQKRLNLIGILSLFDRSNFVCPQANFIKTIKKLPPIKLNDCETLKETSQGKIARLFLDKPNQYDELAQKDKLKILTDTQKLVIIFKICEDLKLNIFLQESSCPHTIRSKISNLNAPTLSRFFKLLTESDIKLSEKVRSSIEATGIVTFCFRDFANINNTKINPSAIDIFINKQKGLNSLSISRIIKSRRGFVKTKGYLSSML